MRVWTTETVTPPPSPPYAAATRDNIGVDIACVCVSSVTGCVFLRLFAVLDP